MRKICVITNSRTDYARLKTLLKALKRRKDIELQLFVIGSHLLPLYGDTIEDIKKDGFKITYKMYNEIDGRVPATMAKSTGLIINDLSSAFLNFRPDVVVVHGDRFESMAAAVTASFMNIPVAHIQGGEVTGTIDEHIRHAITKLSHFHFPSNERAKERILKLGEDQGSVFNCGCPATDILLSTPVLSFRELKSEILKLWPTNKLEVWKRSFNKNFFLVIHHPVTTELKDNSRNIKELFKALKSFDENILVLWPNIDAGSEEIVVEIKKTEKEFGGRMGLFPNFPVNIFVNILRHAKVLIGNSSSGIREACYFGLPAVNIGSRQEGRERTSNVVDVLSNSKEIKKAIRAQLKVGRYEPEYIYGKGGAGNQIAKILTAVDISNIQKRITF